MSKSKSKSKNSIAVGLNLTALMDIFTVLVFFLMVSSEGASENLASSLTLPTIDYGMREISEHNTELIIKYDGGDLIEINGDFVTKSKLTESIKAQGKQQKVELLANKDTEYSDVKSILDSIANAGIPTVSLIVEKGHHD